MKVRKLQSIHFYTCTDRAAQDQRAFEMDHTLFPYNHGLTPADALWNFGGVVDSFRSLFLNASSAMDGRLLLLRDALLAQLAIEVV